MYVPYSRLRDVTTHLQYRIYSRNSRTFFNQDFVSKFRVRDLCEETILHRFTANPRITRLIRSEKSSRNTKTRKVNN